MRVQLLQSLCVVALEPNLLPHVLGRVSSLDGFHVQVALAVLLLDGRIPTIGQGTTASVAKTRDIVPIPQFKYQMLHVYVVCHATHGMLLVALSAMQLTRSGKSSVSSSLT